MIREYSIRWRRAVCAALAIAMIAPLAGTAHARRLKVVTTTSDLGSIVEAVAGEHADVVSIATGLQDPHFLQAKPSYIMQARKADLWVRVGMELEVGWEPPILNGCRNPRIRVGNKGHLDASETILRLEVPTQRVTRGMGDVHPAGNPHYWLDPLNGRLVAQSVCKRLCQLAPDHADAFRANLAAFAGDLDRHMFGEALVGKVGGDKLWALLLNGKLEEHVRRQGLAADVGGWYGQLKPCRGCSVITYHRSWCYFTNRFGLKIAAELEPKPGIPPSGSHLAKVVDTVKSEHVSVVLLEPFYSRKPADLVASRTATKVLVCANSVGGQPGTGTYLELIDHIVARLAGELATHG